MASTRIIPRSVFRSPFRRNNGETELFVKRRCNYMLYHQKSLRNMPRRLSDSLHLSDAGNVDPASSAPAAAKAGDTNSAAQILLMRLGLIHHSEATGIYVILPLLQRSLDKLTGVIDALMQHALGSQKITLPLLNPASWWTASGREELYGAELISLHDRNHKRMVLTPTHEEAVTKMLVNLYGPRSSHKKLPICVHQITSKYRDEQRPRSGLLRCREFIMKDLYIFDADESNARYSYDAVREVYRYLFQNLLLVNDLVECKGSAVKMGGILSHEFFMPAAHGVGEDTVYWCERGMRQRNGTNANDCEYAVNKELLDADPTAAKHRLCADCTPKNKLTNGCDIRNCEHVNTTKAIELGHAFIIGDKYSRLFNANYVDSTNKLTPLVMSCYGIGVTRVLQAVLERSASEDGALRWPAIIAPFQVCFIGPKNGSKEEKRGATHVMNNVLHHCFETLGSDGCFSSTTDALSVEDDIVLDDRSDLSIGNRARQIQKLGIPLIVVFGRASVPESGAAAQVELMHADSKYNTRLVSVEEAKVVVLRQLVQSRKWKLPTLSSRKDANSDGVLAGRAVDKKQNRVSSA